MDLDTTTGDLTCSAGCGSWIARQVIDALVPPDVVKSNARANPFKASPFLPARCLRCKALLEDLYAGTKPVISFGRCIEHGIWIDRETRSAFEATYATEIAARIAIRNNVDERINKLDAEIEAFVQQLAGGETLDRSVLARRVVVLERALLEQARRIVHLENAIAAIMLRSSEAT